MAFNAAVNASMRQSMELDNRRRRAAAQAQEAWTAVARGGRPPDSPPPAPNFAVSAATSEELPYHDDIHRALLTDSRALLQDVRAPLR